MTIRANRRLERWFQLGAQVEEADGEAFDELLAAAEELVRIARARAERRAASDQPATRGNLDASYDA
jgi:hypothetical protein